MTTQEFKAWFEGISEGIPVAPTPEQWTRIRERVAEIEVHPILMRTPSVPQKLSAEAKAKE